MDSGCLDLMKTSLESEEAAAQGIEATFSSHPSAAITDDHDPPFQRGSAIRMTTAQQVTPSEAVDQLTRLMTQRPTEDNPGTDNDPGTEDNTSTEDNPNTEGNTGTGDYPSTEDNPGTEDYPNSEDNSHTKDKSNAENRPSLEDNPDTDGSPNAEDNPVTVGSQNTEGNSNTENIPNVNHKPNTVENPRTDNNANTKDNPKAEINRNTQETLMVVKTAGTRVIWLLIGTQWEKLSDVPDECSKFGVCVCGVSDGIIMIGGCAPKQGVKSCCYHFSVVTKQWKRLKDTPMPLNYASAVELDGIARAGGGRTKC